MSSDVDKFDECFGYFSIYSPIVSGDIDTSVIEIFSFELVITQYWMKDVVTKEL